MNESPASMLFWNHHTIVDRIDPVNCILLNSPQTTLEARDSIPLFFPHHIKLAEASCSITFSAHHTIDDR